MKTSEILYQAADDICMFGHTKGEGFSPGESIQTAPDPPVRLFPVPVEKLGEAS